MHTPNGTGPVAPKPAAPIDLLTAAAFCRQGEYWTIAYEGTVFRLRDTKGLRCVAYLLARPGQPVATLDLLAIGDQFARRESKRSRVESAAPGPERARMAVTKRIRGAIARISAEHPSLGHHLGTCIKTGALCAYTPDPQHARRWRL